MKASATVALLAWFASTAAINAATPPSALDALAVLPPDAAVRVAAIIGFEGYPNPDRWRFLVWDMYAENGFHEYVVADGKIVAKNLFSQFAERVSPVEVMAPEAIQVDSDKVGWLALQYAQVNNMAVSMLRYSLRRTPSMTEPIWKIDCFDEAEQQVGSISVAATDGKVLARLGFVSEPTEAGLATAAGAESSKPKSSSSRKSTRSKSSTRRSQPPAVAERVRRAEPVRRPSALSRVFRSLFRSDD